MEWSRDGNRTSISALPDEILHRILSKEYDEQDVDWTVSNLTVLPLVCKKWRAVLYLQGAHLAE